MDDEYLYPKPLRHPFDVDPGYWDDMADVGLDDIFDEEEEELSLQEPFSIIEDTLDFQRRY